LSYVSRTISYSEKYLAVESQVANPNPSVVKATLGVICFFKRRVGAENLVRDLRKS
jgi:hypothetical protein